MTPAEAFATAADVLSQASLILPAPWGMICSALSIAAKLSAKIAVAGTDPAAELERIHDTWHPGLAKVEARERDRLEALRRGAEDIYADGETEGEDT
jgi:hypothetical protein